jgi:hypothetical protein
METSLNAFRRNQHVIAALLKGDYEASRFHSQVAVDVIETLLTRPCWNDDSAASDKRQAGREHIAGGRVWSIPLSPSNNYLNVANDGAVPFFNQALAFHVGDHQHTQDAFYQNTAFAAVVFYNAGLTQHLSAIHCSTLRTHRLKKALHAYSLASCLLSSAAASPNGLLCGCDEGVDLVVLALLNNMAHIHSFFFDMKLVTECVEAMEDVLDNPSIGSDDDSSDIAHDDMFFTMAASLYQEDSFAGCPAA